MSTIVIKPIISVIIPAFNAEDTILESIYSVLNQDTEIFEIIVINDGSTDNTEELLKNFQLKHNINLKILFQPNCGPSKARNVGIKNASGDWIAFLDADDIWLNDKISKQIEVISRNKNCVILGTLFQGNKFRMSKKKIKTLTFKKMLFKNQLFTSSVLVKKDVIKKYFFDENKKYSEDYKLWLQILFEHQGLVINEGLVVYDIRGDLNKSNRLSKKLWVMERNEIDNYIFLKKENYINNFLMYIAIIFSLCKFCIRMFYQIFSRLFHKQF